MEPHFVIPHFHYCDDVNNRHFSFKVKSSHVTVKITELGERTFKEQTLQPCEIRKFYIAIPQDKMHQVLNWIQQTILPKILENKIDDLEPAYVNPEKIPPESEVVQTAEICQYLLTIRDFTDSIRAMCEFQPGLFAMGDGKGILSLWTYNDEFKAHSKPILTNSKRPITSLLSPSAGILVSSSEENSIKVWKYINNDWTLLKVLSGHEGAVNDLHKLDQFQIASASSDQTIKIWNNFACTHTLQGHEGAVRCIRKLSNGMLVSGSSDQKVKFWDPSNQFKCSHTYRNHPSEICSLNVFGEDNLAIGYQDGTIELIETVNYALIGVLKGHSKKVHSIVNLPSPYLTSYLVTASADQTMKIWALSTLEAVYSFDHESEVLSLSTIEDKLLSSSMDKNLYVWQCSHNQ